MDRREAMAAMLGAVLLPSWWRKSPAPIPLDKFCDTGGGQSFRRFDCSRPFVQGDGRDLHTYATDCRICLRIPGRDADKGDAAGRRPPAMKLHWETIDRMRGWKRWPSENHLLMRDAFCPACDGLGTADGKIGQECEKCQGLGYFWHGGYGTATCTVCDGKGILGPWCSSCQGNAIGTFPGVQEVGCEIVQARYDRLIRRHLRDVEYAIVVSPVPAKNLLHAVAIRFDGGCGLLMPMDANRRADILT